MRPPTLNELSPGMQGLKCLVYLDIVIYGASLEDHNKKLEEDFGKIN